MTWLVAIPAPASSVSDPLGRLSLRSPAPGAHLVTSASGTTESVTTCSGAAWSALATLAPPGQLWLLQSLPGPPPPAAMAAPDWQPPRSHYRPAPPQPWRRSLPAPWSLPPPTTSLRLGPPSGLTLRLGHQPPFALRPPAPPAPSARVPLRRLLKGGGRVHALGLLEGNMP
nr:formin-like protein 5 [Aegilops tauschii subsp. strangulata]